MRIASALIGYEQQFLGSMLVGMTMGTARLVLKGRYLAVETRSPIINGCARNIEPANSGGDTEIKRIGHDRLTKASDL